jgi:hypothetical protein
MRRCWSCAAEAAAHAEMFAKDVKPRHAPPDTPGAEEDRPVYAGGMRSGLGSGEAAVASREDARM